MNPVVPNVCSREPEMPLSCEEAKWFYEGFKAGATAYAGEVGHSQVLTGANANDELRKVFTEQGWQTMECYERTPPMPGELQKRIAEWLASNQKTPEQVRHGTFPLGMVQSWIDRALRAEALAKSV